MATSVFKYDYATFTDALGEARSTNTAKFVEFVKDICDSSLRNLDVVFKQDEFGQSCFSINGSEPKVFTGYNYVYMVRLFMDRLTAIGYFE